MSCSPRVNTAVQDSLVGKALRRRDAATIVGKGLCKTLFIHAGLSPLMLKALLRQSGSSISAAHHLDTLNALIAGIVSPHLLHAAFHTATHTKVTSISSQEHLFELCDVCVCTGMTDGILLPRWLPASLHMHLCLMCTLSRMRRALQML